MVMVAAVVNVVAVVVVGLGALVFVLVRRRRQSGAVMIMDGGPQVSKGFSVISGSTYYDDALSLKSATTLMLAQDAVVEQRLFEELQQRFQEQLAAAKEEFESANRATRAAHDAAATAEFMRRQYPNAVQCPRCHAGPVIPENCYDLQAHHGETLGRGRGRISNACPSCGFFSRERGDWVRWDGQMR